MRQLVSALLDFIFPRYCAVCDDILSESEHHLCIRCFMDLPRTGMHKMEHSPLEQYYWGKIPIEKATSFIFYKEGFKEILLNLKYRKNHAIGEYFGNLMAREISQESDFFDTIDVMIPIPLHRRRLWSRGYNQSDYIARGISSVTGIPIYNNVVQRKVNNMSQTLMSHKERQQNVTDIFCCTRPELLRGKHILLIDDVITTGATTLSCAKSILEALHSPFPFDGDESEFACRFSIISLAFAK